MPVSSGVYLIVNTATAKVYIGQTSNLERRFAQHKQALRSHAHHNTQLQADWDAMGPDAFIFRVHALLPKERLSHIEFSLISSSLGVGCYNAPWADRNQGRKPLDGACKTKPRSVRLTDVRWGKLKALGSEWLAKAIDEAERGVDFGVTKKT